MTDPYRESAPTGLQLDLLTTVSRLEQVADELLAGSLVASRLITCDLPRLREHLTPETLAWEAEQ